MFTGENDFNGDIFKSICILFYIFPVKVFFVYEKDTAYKQLFTVLNLFSQFQVLLNCTPFTHIHFQVYVTTEIIILHLDSYLCLPMKENLLTSLKKRW